MRFALFVVLWCVTVGQAPAASLGAEDGAIRRLPLRAESQAARRTDWLIDAAPFRAGVYRTAHPHEIALDNGLVRRTFRLAPNGATVGLDNLMTGEAVLRGVKPEAIVVLDGQRYEVGGLVGQPNYAYLTADWLEQLTADPAALQLAGWEVGQPQERLAWKRTRQHGPDVRWPPTGVYLRMDYAGPPGLTVSVHYELYDGVPVMSKWISVHNATDKTVTVDRFTSEILAVVEHSNWVECRDVALPTPDSLHVETDFAFGGFEHANANRHIVHWRSDSQYATQVNYLRQQPCLLVVEPTYGPAQDIEPGAAFESCRAFELVYDSSERERRGLALRRMYRTIAPWVTENPLMHHLRIAQPDQVRAAIDQAAEVGFEMIILSFGSGFDMDNEDPQHLATWKEISAYARSRGIEIGSYSLLSSRAAPAGEMIVSPAGQQPTHGQCPALASRWGQDYFRRLYQFFPRTGFQLLEHDGSYPGDVDVTPRPPLQKGEQDSRWVQWRIIRDFYRWCRGEGIYLNVPDYYFLCGSNKCGMGYRETNWSLPRAQQVLHTRQNIYDGTWTKTPSMGWMFVPLSQYHGGGAAATIEPLDEHRDHYERMLVSNLAMGVQACYRGPRLYDTDRTKQLVATWVAWFKKYREILESDVIHGRRPDGRDVDWMLHANPRLPCRGMLVVFNPLDTPVKRTLRVNLYYTGLTAEAEIREQDAAAQTYPLARDYTVELPVEIGADSFTWFTIVSPGDSPDATR